MAGLAAPLVALDCEMIELEKPRSMVAARVAMVDQAGETVLDCFVRHDISAVRSFHTQYSGIREEHVDGSSGEAVSLAQARDAVVRHAKGRVLVAHNLPSDLRALSLALHELDGCAGTIDTAALDWGERERNLRALADELLDLMIQTSEHSPVEDALACLRLAELHARAGTPPLPSVTVRVEKAKPADPAELSIRWCRSELVALLRAELLPVGDGRGALQAEVPPLGAPAGAPADEPSGETPAEAAGAEHAARALSVAFPPSLRKAQRKLVHDVAAEFSLSSHSQGVGSQRAVLVARPQDANVAAAAGHERRHGRRRGRGRGRGRDGDRQSAVSLPDEAEALATRLYRCAQEEGGAVARYSHDEIRELVSEQARGGSGCEEPGRPPADAPPPCVFPDDLQRLAEEQLLLGKITSLTMMHTSTH